MLASGLRTRRRRGIVGAILLLIILGWVADRFYYNRFAMTASITPTTRTIEAITRPYFAHVTRLSRRIVWTRTADAVPPEQPIGAPWHRDWLITITGTARNPWQLRPLTIDVYVNGQHGGIEGWYIPLRHAHH